eukprot:scaffold957_cov402-Prasinococcus_capsulatus_cf.AAC.5
MAHGKCSGLWNPGTSCPACGGGSADAAVDRPSLALLASLGVQCGPCAAGGSAHCSRWRARRRSTPEECTRAQRRRLLRAARCAPGVPCPWAAPPRRWIPPRRNRPAQRHRQRQRRRHRPSSSPTAAPSSVPAVLTQAPSGRRTAPARRRCAPPMYASLHDASRRYGRCSGRPGRVAARRPHNCR